MASFLDFIEQDSKDLEAVESGKYVGVFNGTIRWREVEFTSKTTGAKGVIRSLSYGVTPTGKVDRDLTEDELADLNALGLLDLEQRWSNVSRALQEVGKTVVKFGGMTNDELDSLDMASFGVTTGTGGKLVVTDEKKCTEGLAKLGKKLEGKPVQFSLKFDKDGRARLSNMDTV